MVICRFFFLCLATLFSKAALATVVVSGIPLKAHLGSHQFSLTLVD